MSLHCREPIHDWSRLLHLYHLPKDAPALPIKKAGQAIILDDAPLLQDYYVVKRRVDAGDRLQPVSYCDDGPVTEVGLDQFVDKFLGVRIHAVAQSQVSRGQVLERETGS